MSSEALTWAAVALFLSATIWTAARARTWSDASLPLGLACVTLASALRIPVVVDAIRQVTASPVDEVVKHVTLAVGCLMISGWVTQTLTGKTPALRLISGTCVGAVILMAVTFVASGPWEAADIDTQTAGKPSMIVYWAVFYGTFLWATSWFALAALRSRSQRIWQLRWGMDLAAGGAGIAVVWAIISFVALLKQMLGADGPHLVLGIQTRYLIAASSALTTVGLIGHLASAAILARRRRSGLAHLHRYIAASVSATVPPLARDRAIDSYHRTIQILDGIGVLAHYSTAADRAALTARLPTSSPEILMAHQLRLSVKRRADGEPPSATPGDWTECLADEAGLRRLGHALQETSDQVQTDDVPAGAHDLLSKPDSEPGWARAVTEVLAPAYTVAASVLAIGLLSAAPSRAWWQVPLLIALAAGIPYLFIHGLARLGVWESRHVRPRQQRLVALSGLLVIEIAVLSIMAAVGAPPLMLQLLAACIVGVLTLALVTPIVRASIHVGVFSVTAGIAAAFSWNLAAALVALSLLVGAARIRVKDHTPIEVTTGLAMGFVAGLAATRLLVS